MGQPRARSSSNAASYTHSAPTAPPLSRRLSKCQLRALLEVPAATGPSHSTKSRAPPRPSLRASPSPNTAGSSRGGTCCCPSSPPQDDSGVSPPPTFITVHPPGSRRSLLLHAPGCGAVRSNPDPSRAPPRSLLPPLAPVIAPASSDVEIHQAPVATCIFACMKRRLPNAPWSLESRCSALLYTPRVLVTIGGGSAFPFCDVLGVSAGRNSRTRGGFSCSALSSW